MAVLFLCELKMDTAFAREREGENSVTWLKLLETQPVHCVHTPEISSCESCGGNTFPNVSEDANFLICSRYCFLGAGAGESSKSDSTYQNRSCIQRLVAEGRRGGF